MSLRTRLWLVLGGLFLLPLVVGGLLLAILLPDARSQQVTGSARTAAAAALAEVAERCATLGLAARNAALEATAAESPEQGLTFVVEGGYADYAALLGADSSVVAEAGDAGRFDPARPASCSEGAAADGVMAERVAVTGVDGVVRVVVALDLADLLADLQVRAGTDSAVLLLHGEDGSVAATTASAATARTIAAAVQGRRGTFDLDGWSVRATRTPGVAYAVVVAVPDPDDGLRTTPLVLIVGAAVLASGLLVTSVARDLSRPYAELTRAAERVAHGDLDTEVEAGEEGEAGRLGSALNQLTDELRRNLRELERSRQELRGSLERIGDTLTATHDLDGLLNVVLDTAQATLGGAAGLVAFRTRDRVELVAEQGLDEVGLTAPARVDPGVGVLGRVLTTGRPVRGRLGSGRPELAPAGDEPGQGEVLAVPLRSMGSVLGVLALYGRADGRPFDRNDEEALGTLAGQASIAIDNVQLHQEAQRLSTTDALTGLWNFRYLSMSLAREIERSTRFDRPLAVLMLDLDHFKQVNDVHGHARGDTVLRELAERVQEQIREVDTFARYGGEEFVVVLPETTIDGAALLAERICEAVRREPFRAEGEEDLRITVSIGGSAFPDHGSSPATLMRAADKALYVAKAQGRDRAHVPGASPG